MCRGDCAEFNQGADGSVRSLILCTALSKLRCVLSVVGMCLALNAYHQFNETVLIEGEILLRQADQSNAVLHVPSY